MAEHVSNDFAGTVGPVPDADDLGGHVLVGTPDYVSGGGHDVLTTSVQFAPEEYVSYSFDFGDSESARIWVTTPAVMDTVGQDWTVFEWCDGAGNPLLRAGWNPNGRWKLYTVAGAVSVTAPGGGSAVVVNTQYGLVFDYDLNSGYMSLRVHNASTDAQIVEIYSGAIPDEPPVSLRVGNRQPSDDPIRLSDFTLANNPLTIGDPPPETLGLIGTRLGIPTETGISLVTKTGTDVDQVRVRVQRVSDHSLVTTSDAVFPDSQGYALHTITGLAPDTEYEHRIDGYDDGTATWALLDNPWTGSSYLGPWSTFPSTVTDFAFRFALEACAHRQPERDAYDKIASRSPLFKIKGGDQNYKNRTDTATPPHFVAWEEAWAIDNGMAEVDAQIPSATERSDHDGGEGGNAGAGEPGTIYALQAILSMVPTAGTMLADGTLAQSFRVDRHTFILPDFRSQFRTAHDAPSGSRTCYGTAQLAALVDEIHAAGQRGDMIWFATDAIVTGTPETLLTADHPKTDALPVYVEDYAAICAALGWYPTAHAWLAADYHALGLVYEHPVTGGPVVNYAGSVTQFGNMRNPEDFDEVFQGAAGSRGNVFFDIDVDRTGDTGTYEVHGWDARADIEEITHEFEFDLSDPPPLPEVPSTPRLFLFDGDAMNTYAKGIEEVRPSTPAMRGADAVIPYWDGRQWNAFKSFDDTDLTFIMHAAGADDNGFVSGGDPQRALCRSNLDDLTRIFANGKLVEIKRRFGDEYRVIFGQVVNSIDFSFFDDKVAKFSVTFRCPKPFWRDETIRSQVVDYDFASVGNVWFSDFAGATARSQSAVIEAYGYLRQPKFKDTGGPSEFRYTGQVQSSKRLTVDVIAGTALKDEPGDPEVPADDEIELIEKFQSGPLITLTPGEKDGIVGLYGMRINVAEPPGTGAQIRLTDYRWYMLHG